MWFGSWLMIDPVFQSQSIMVHSFYRSKHIFKPKSYVGNPSKIAICLMSFASLCLFSNRAPCKLRFEFYVHLCWSFMHRNPRATLLFLEEFQTELFSLKICFDLVTKCCRSTNSFFIKSTNTELCLGSPFSMVEVRHFTCCSHHSHWLTPSPSFWARK